MALLESIFNHLVLPPKLPGQQDEDKASIENSILSRLMHACDTLGNLSGHEFMQTWVTLHNSLSICSSANQGRLEKSSMLHNFRNFQQNDLLILHVVEQNAALLIRRHASAGEDTVIFEAFEASPSSENVLAAENAIQWDFPGRAAEIPLHEFLSGSFQESLTDFLEKASMESLDRFAARSNKAKASVVEVRDTNDPALVTQFLMPLLEAVGSSVDVPRIRKRVRDDVNMRSAEIPWRRLPLWLVLRVAAQRQLCLTLGDETGRACYKFLIATVLAELLRDCPSQLAPELTMMLKAKLCRRLAKLEMDSSRASDIYRKLFSKFRAMFEGIIEEAIEQVQLAWTSFKRAITRPIPKLPSHADEHALRLSLPNSGRYLHNLLGLPHSRRPDLASLDVIPSGDAAIKEARVFTDRYFNLAKLESATQTERNPTPQSVARCETRCIELAGSVEDLFTTVGSAYESNPEQMSIFILNLFELWIQMDECAVKACPLLCNYHPGFSPELLDVLQLPTLPDMQRLQNIQRYLQDRCNKSEFSHKTIFSEPDGKCFAVRYVRQSARLCKLRKRIEGDSAMSRQKKDFEWERTCEQYDDLSQKISEGTCVCSIGRDGTRNVKGCTKCWRWRCRKRLKIAIHEDFLPEDSARKDVVVFELGVPGCLAAYRNATWRIFSSLGHPSRPSATSQPAMILKDYSQLSPYAKRTIGGVTLASTIKSFLQTHYKELKMKVNRVDVLLPLGLQFSYYDMNSGIWLKDLDRPLTFEHLCGVHVPRSLQVSVINLPMHPAPSTDGPSSYEVVASQTKCPPNMSVHEFTAYQRLLSGKDRRWLTMLVELGASNLNFSTEDTMHVFCQLAIQAGPAQDETDALRDTHFVFRDPSFCERLTEQIDNRLRNITSNWRETHCMEMLITLSLRLFSLTSGPLCQAAERLLKAARDITLQWVTRLRIEIRNAEEADVAQRAAMYGFWAALLCRRTFTTFVRSDSGMDAEDLSSFVQASVALQENLVVDLAKLPLSLKNMLVRDTKMAYEIQSLIQESIQSNPSGLGDAINKTWSDLTNSNGRTYSPWQFMPHPNQRWVRSIITSRGSKFAVPQVVHYNFLEGHLLVDGKPLGKLPRDIRESEDVKELFGNQHLLTYPSSFGDMTHAMATRILGHEIHFGLRGKDVVIRALTRDALLEYVPRRVFMSNDSFDLPVSLVENCVHWINLDSGHLEIRRRPTIWKTRMSDWAIDVVNRQAWRKRVLLVDPHSNVCKQVANIFRHFEDPQKLTVFQPSRGKLCVELRHLELSFVVRGGLLVCRELNAEIDPNQDAGTLYGFQSKIVLRDVANIKRRSIITPLGELACKRHGMHVAIRASSANDYGRFGIDDVLGRLSCPPEPRLLYCKARLHAFTSFVLPDPLTGRTGAEEALQTLKSGYCQPWTPIADLSASILRKIGALSPVREYYPKNIRRLQKVIWDENLTMSIQHDSYEPLVRDVLEKSDRLRAFSLHNKERTEYEAQILPHLRKRGEIRRLLYERDSSGPGGSTTQHDVVYQPRDRNANLPQASNVYQIVRLIRKRPFSIHMKRDLVAILHEWKLIDGFRDMQDNIPGSLDSLIERNIDEQWGSLVNACRQTKAHDSYRLIFRLGLLSFGTNPNMDAIKSLAAFGCVEELKALQPPPYTSFAEFKLNASPTLESLLSRITVDYPILEQGLGPITGRQDPVRVKHRNMYETACKSLARHFLEQWPSSQPSTGEFESTTVDVGLALERILPEWQRLHQNMDLSKYITLAQGILNHHKGTNDTSKPRAWSANSTAFHPSNRGSIIPSISRDLLTKCGPLPCDHSLLPIALLPQRGHSTNKRSDVSHKIGPSKEVIELGRILNSFTRFPGSLRQRYGNDLKESLTALENSSSQPEQVHALPSVNVVIEGIRAARDSMNEHIGRIRNALSAGDSRYKWLQLGNLWPCLTPITVLEQLRSSSSHQFGKDMREALVSYGILVTNLQRLLRIQHAQLKGDQRKLFEEWHNAGHENWSPLDFTDWLLLEIESDILIRPEQVDVAHAIISPASRSNSVLQLNMGKGKTSCIVPMAAAVLGNKKQLTRLIVPKALLLQSAQTMQSRLGGLVGREIRHIPFSRRTSTAMDMLQQYSKIHHEMLRCCGVILTTPEHILSYKLSGLQLLVESKLESARKMIKFQSWLTDTCRDVLDESDFTLAVKTQLIYPSGSQISVDGHPHRWQVAQILLSLVEDHLPDLQHKFPQSIEITQRPSGYPMVHFLQTDVEDALHRRIINDIREGRTPFLRFAGVPSLKSKSMIRLVLSDENASRELIKQTSHLFVDASAAYKNILLIRGLLLNRILLLCLKKRWNVQYGLHPNRDPIAVPFEAKGIPSEQAEFGHPDVSILFTCLAFYYSGLNRSQFREGLQCILNSNDPSTEYERWIHSSNTLPEALHHWNVINVDDQGQVEELWHHLRLNRNVLDHYMNNFIFPVHAKQFNVKLQASGWDLPLFSKPQPGESETCGAKTTGFSGTNDNKMMLPLTIRQDDLPGLRQTNAEVLAYLLQKRNRGYEPAAWNGKRLTEEGLLRRIETLEIRILIDAGAFILEMDNYSLVNAWLNIDKRAKGAVYFGADNRAWVQYRGGKKAVPLLATPFAENLDEFLVYLDEAHTRGIDLKLPQHARGALTLALGQTKDHTVQGKAAINLSAQVISVYRLTNPAAMRLRQLGSTQSLIFFAPPEVHQSILDVCKMGQGEMIDSSHVVRWLMEQTCRANEQLQNLYVAQGTDFCHRTSAQWENAKFMTDTSHRQAYLKVIQHPERQTLEQLYGGMADTQPSSPAAPPSAHLKDFMVELNEQRNAAKGNGNSIHSSALEEVEQEREVEFEVEEVRQTQKPKHYTALTFPGLHEAILRFVKTGDLTGGSGYEHAFSALARTGIGMKHSVCSTESRLFVSVEFTHTVDFGKQKPNDNFLRPVEWILWSPSREIALIVIPEEVELLIPIIRAEIRPKVHLATYATPVTKDMSRFNKLSYYVLPCLPLGYTIPDWLSIELGIFAGRLYLDFAECSRLKEYLQLTDKTDAETTQKIDDQGSPFVKDPAGFLLEWLTLCRKGQDIAHTPMGYICQGRSLNENHAFFAARCANGQEVAIATIGGGKLGDGIGDDEEEDTDIEDEWDIMGVAVEDKE
ncbi:hypothetical protein GP486_000104 [Trichoglossum hirsutum]|uniref:ubiquitinyl hydrolase 1 n=1 Tax=Trichoglossum hirsutum TaxID=265104 RepID=A0A9P8LJD6_9PEZI|nr:hypothetical protein GP486_000104 [Trichoglossum hirsutum]